MPVDTPVHCLESDPRLPGVGGGEDAWGMWDGEARALEGVLAFEGSLGLAR